MHPNQEVAPSAQPQKQIRKLHALNHDARALHPTYVSEKESGKRFIAKSVAAPQQANLFPEGKAKNKMLQKALTSQLNDLMVSPLQPPVLLRSFSDQDKVSMKDLFESDNSLMERLKDIVERLALGKSSFQRDIPFLALFERLQIESQQNNIVQRELLSLKKCLTSNSKTKQAILSSFDRVERSALGITKEQQQERQALADQRVEHSSSSDTEVISLSSGTTDSEISSIGVERLSEIKQDINNSIQSYITQKLIETFTLNLQRAQSQSESASEKAYYHLVMSDLKKAVDEIETKSQTQYMSAGQRLEELCHIPRFGELLQGSTTYKSLFESYAESVALSERNGYIEKILSALPPELSTSELDKFTKELSKAADFPLKRAIYLKESADAQKEVFAQELIRALAPTVAICANPYPKYRLATDTITDKSDLGIVPNIPQVLVASEQISFDSRSLGYAQKDNSGRLSSNIIDGRDLYIVHQKNDLAGSRLIPIESIPGFGATMQFAKFLGNTDAKPGNIGLRLGNGQDYPTMVTNLDSGLCFTVNPKVFKDSKEVSTPGLLTKEDVCNYFYQRADWDHYSSLNKFFQESAEHPQVKRENRITALHIALIPPEIYEVFAKQYLLKDENPFLRNNDTNPDFFENERSFDTVVRQHIIEKGEATFQNFLKDDRLFGYFLESGRAPQENIFQVFQNLMVQLEGFRFYEKHDFKSALSKEQIESSLYDMVERRFLELVTQKIENSTPENRQTIKTLLKSWEPTQVQVDREITKKDSLQGTNRAETLTSQSIERGNALKSKVADIILRKESASLLEKGRMNSPRPQSATKLAPLNGMMSSQSEKPIAMPRQQVHASGLSGLATLERRSTLAPLPKLGIK